jgi:hypothetical protein
VSQDWADAKARELVAEYRADSWVSPDLALTKIVQRFLREAYERGAVEMRERAALSAFPEVINPAWPDVGAYRQGRLMARNDIRALPASPKEPK